MQPSSFVKLSLQDRLKEENEPKLKLDEMILIFQRLPTSELIRFISNIPKHPLGKFWSGGLKFVLEKRLPFSLKATVVNRPFCRITDHVIYDCNGSKVADIKRPEYFNHSPLCALVEEVDLPVRFCSSSKANLLRESAWAYSLDGMNVLHIRLSIPALVNLNTLNLSFWVNDSWWPPITSWCDSALAKSLSPELMSQLESLSLSTNYTGGPGARSKNFANLLSRATGLKKLCVTEAQFFALLTRGRISAHLCHPESRLTVASIDMSAEVRNVFAGLESLTVVRGHEVSSEAVLEFISTRCTSLVKLDLPLRGSIRLYFAAFQALPHLTKLGLNAMGSRRNELVVEEADAAVSSVTDFCVQLNPNSNDEHVLLAMLSKLPGLRVLHVEGCHFDFMLMFASTVCSNSILRHLQTLKCSRIPGTASYAALLQFMGDRNTHFPTTVDLSELQVLPGPNVAHLPHRSEFLVDLCKVMEGNSINLLFLKAVVRQDAFDRLREHLSLAKQTTLVAKANKLLAWKKNGICGVNPGNFPLGQGHVTQFTDFIIEGTKTSGPAKGAEFKIRIYHG